MSALRVGQGDGDTSEVDNVAQKNEIHELRRAEQLLESLLPKTISSFGGLTRIPAASRESYRERMGEYMKALARNTLPAYDFEWLEVATTNAGIGELYFDKRAPHILVYDQHRYGSGTILVDSLRQEALFVPMAYDPVTANGVSTVKSVFEQVLANNSGKPASLRVLAEALTAADLGNGVELVGADIYRQAADNVLKKYDDSEFFKLMLLAAMANDGTRSTKNLAVIDELMALPKNGPNLPATRQKPDPVLTRTAATEKHGHASQQDVAKSLLGKIRKFLGV